MNEDGSYNYDNNTTPDAKRLHSTPTVDDGRKDVHESEIDADEKVVPMIDRYPNSSTTTNNAGSKDELLHSGPLLGDLPSLSGTPGGSSNSVGVTSHNGMKQGKLSPEQIRAGRGLQAVLASDGASDGSAMVLSTEERERFLRESRRRQRGTKKKKKIKDNTGLNENGNNSDAPPEFLCALSKQLMSDPVESSSGIVFDRMQITTWIHQQGHICPITGAPLSENELRPKTTLKNKIQTWILKKSQQPSSSNYNNDDGQHEALGITPGTEGGDITMPSVASPKSKISGSRSQMGGSAVVGSLGAASFSSGTKDDVADNDDDLYDF